MKQIAKLVIVLCAALFLTGIKGCIFVTVSPATVTLALGQSRQFSAVLKGTDNTAVVWMVNEGAAWGTITSQGLYTAPAKLPSPAIATVRAVSSANPTFSGTALVTLTQGGGGQLTVTIAPATATLALSQSQQFIATVTGTQNTAVLWSVDGGSAYGTITSQGLYTAPATLPSPASATVRAVSAIDSTAFATALVTLTAQGGAVTVTVSPSTATLALGATQQFTATVTGTQNTAVLWSVDGGSAYGTITSQGLYTAPATLPSPASATLRAVSAADSTASGTALVTFTQAGGVTVTISPATATLALGQTQQFIAIVTGTQNTAVTWSVDGGSAYGSISSGGLYTAPASLPSPAAATVRATSAADSSASATALITLTQSGSQVTVTISPASATIALGQSLQFTATVTGTQNTAVTWGVDGGTSYGTITSQGLYTAPATLPSPASATVRAVSAASPTAFGTAQVTLSEEGEDSFSIDAFAYKDPRPATYQPLSQKTLNLVKSEELLLLMPDSSRKISGWVLDDKPGEYKELGTIGDGSAPFNKKNETIWDTVSADFNNDGKDEAAVVSIFTNSTSGSGYIWYYNDIRVQVIDHTGSSFAVSSEFTISAGTKCYLNAHITSGDIDGDGKPEFIISATKGTNQDNTYKNAETCHVFVYDDAAAGLTLLKEIKFEGADVRVAAGDIDGDGRDEIIVCGWVRDYYNSANYTFKFDAWAYDDAAAGYAELKHWGKESIFYGTNTSGIEVLTGDTDGDNLDEIIFIGNDGLNVAIYDDATAGFKSLQSSGIQTYSGSSLVQDDHYNSLSTLDAAIGDFNGDGLAELVILKKLESSSGMYGQKSYTWNLYHFVFNKDRTKYASEKTTIEVASSSSPFNTSDSAAALAIADDNRDNKDEAIVSYYTSNTLYRYRFAANFSSNYYRFEKTDTYQKALTLSTIRKPFTLGGDFDADNMRVQNTGEHWLSLPDPMLIVAMAAPPAQDGISQNYGQTQTAYGTAVSSGTSETHEVGITAGVTLSFEAGDPFGIIEASASVKLETEFTKTKTTSEMVTYGTSMEGSYPDDYVIFQGTLYNCYEYLILAHPQAELIGTHMTIDVPVKTKVFKWTVDYFNKNNGSARDIGEETFTHTSGKVSTYPSLEQKNEIMTKYTGWQSDSMTVGQGSGQNVTYINLAEEKTTGESLSIGVDVSSGIKVAGVGMEFSVGYKNTNIYEITIGKETSYEGTVGDISNPTDYTKYN